ncbi:MAG: MMPL family transporter, partial [Fibrobacteria bacterium]
MIPFIRDTALKSSERSGLWYKLVHAYVELSHRRPWLPLLVLALLTWLTTILAGKLRIDTDLRVLLPKGTPSVVALQEAEKRMGSTDLFTIAFESPSPEAVGAFQKAVSDSLAHWQEVVWTQYDQDRSFFERHALLYLPTDQLTDLRDRISGMIGADFAQANPLIESLDDDAPKPSLKGWPDPEALRRQGLPQDMVDALLAKLQKHNGDSAAAASAQAKPGDEPRAPPRPDSLKNRLMGWHEDKKVWVGVVLAQLNRPSTDAIFAKGIYERGTAMLESMKPDSYEKGLNAKVAGAYRNFSEINQVNSDIITAGIISFTLMVLLLWFFVRRVVNLVIINVPLFVAMSWTTGLTFVIYQRLTILTAFILALILGLGIEYTVHLYSRWAEENRKGLNPLDAMIEAVYSTGRSLLSGAATNIFAMLSLQLGHFKGFKEFGIVVSIGITFALITTWLVIPPLFFLFSGLAGFIEKRAHSRILNKAVSFLLPGTSSVQGGLLLPKMTLSLKTIRWVALIALLFTVGISFGPA